MLTKGLSSYNRLFDFVTQKLQKKFFVPFISGQWFFYFEGNVNDPDALGVVEGYF